MLNTQKLLYVLPDLAYIAELLPDKKPYTFSIQSFKQINGDFLDETEFKAENIVKLINKLEIGEEYFLVLPDFLFTNTIISVQETSDAKIKEKLSTETLPKMGLKDDSHLIETVVLNQLKGTTRVQLSAIEKSVLSVFKVAAAEKDIKITGIAPLSWTIKSLVSLEPSISVLQLGTKLYTAQHYIGVDQTTTATIDQPENIIETIKTLKGAEPSIQTVYLCSNALIEDKLKDSLSKILPIQQMAVKDGTEKIPSYVSQIIVASQRTLAIPDFSVPTFKLTKPTPEEKEKYAALLTAAGVDTTDDEENEVATEIPKPQISPVPPPVEEPEKAEIAEEKTEESTDKLPDIEHADDIENVTQEQTEPVNLPDIEDAKEEPSKDETAEPPSILPAAGTVAAGALTTAATGISPAAASITPPVLVGDSLSNDTIAEAAKIEQEEQQTSETPKVEPTPEVKTVSEEVKPEVVESVVTPPAKATDESANTISPPAEASTTESLSTSSTPAVVVGASQVDTQTLTDSSTLADEDTVLKQFAQNGETAVESSNNSKPIIKNKSGAKNMMKMILITTGVFILTVAVGIGVGLAILKYSGNNQPAPPPVVEVEQPTPAPTATPEASPTASASASLDKSAVSLLVVNATTKAGYAGQIQTKLEDAEFEDVSTGNAKGDYDEGNFIYMSEENAALIAAIKEATGLEFTATPSARVEDTQGNYDAVVVLAE